MPATRLEVFMTESGDELQDRYILARGVGCIITSGVFNAFNPLKAELGPAVTSLTMADESAEDVMAGLENRRSRVQTDAMRDQ